MVQNCLVEVVAIFYKEGSYLKAENEQHTLWSKSLDDWSEEVTHEEYLQANKEHRDIRYLSMLDDEETTIRLTSDNIAFQFNFVGQCSDGMYSSALEADCMEGSYELIEQYIEELAADATKFREAFLNTALNIKKRRLGDSFRFLTLWKYESWDGGYYEDDYDSSVDYMGVIDFSKLNSILLPR